VGRSVAALLIMVVVFAGLAALFVGLDGAAGVHPPSPLFAAGSRRRVSIATPAAGTTALSSRTPPVGAEARTATVTTGAPSLAPITTTPAALSSATGTMGIAPASVTAPAAGTSSATDTTPSASVTTTGTVTATGTVSATGDTPPHYGALLNYPNNTRFTPAFMQSLAEQTIALTNAQRVAHGLPTLSESGQLDIIAASRSQDQIQRQYCGHYDPTGPVDANGKHAAAVQELLTRDGVSYTEVGENLICRVGYALNTATPHALVDSWMQHPEHRDNILHTGYTMIGIGMAAKDEPDGLHVIVAQVFVH
jgi:uncharacterized protein YkwD